MGEQEKDMEQKGAQARKELEQKLKDLQLTMGEEIGKSAAYIRGFFGISSKKE